MLWAVANVPSWSTNSLSSVPPPGAHTPASGIYLQDISETLALILKSLAPLENVTNSYPGKIRRAIAAPTLLSLVVNAEPNLVPKT